MQSLATLLLALAGAGVPEWEEAEPPSWPLLTGLASRHGILGLVEEGARAMGVPAQVAAAWQRERTGRERLKRQTLQQLRELVVAAGAAGVEILALKGSAALLTLYPDPGARDLLDLDLLVRERHGEAAISMLRGLGYEVRADWTAAEFQALHLAHGEGLAFLRSGSRMVELHTCLDLPRVPVEEAWERSAEVRGEGVPVRVLCPEHFILHTALHYLKHLDLDFAPLKGMLDVVLAVRRYGPSLDWPEFWAAADRWGARTRAGVVLATIHRRWGVPVPGLPAGAEPLPAEVLVFGRKDLAERRRRHHADATSAGLRRLRHLPGAAARCRYLVRQVIPEPAHLRHRYGVPEGGSLWPAYVRHPFHLLARLAGGAASSARRRLSRNAKGSAAPLPMKEPCEPHHPPAGADPGGAASAEN